MRQRTRSEHGEVLIEIRRIGTHVRVAAIDPVTGTEVSVPGSCRGSLEALTHIAIRKLSYVLARRAGSRRQAFFA